MNDRDRDILDYLTLTTFQKGQQAGEIWRTEVARSPAATGQSGRPFKFSAPHGQEDRPRITRDLRLVPLPTLLPYRIGAFELALSGGGNPPSAPLDRLALLLRYAACPLRWDVLNIYNPHFAAASPRSLMLCDLYLAIHGGGVAPVYRYVPDHQALVPTGQSLPSSDDRSGLSIFIVGNLSRCVTPYGDFSICLTSLEVGAVAAQLALLGRAVGWEGPARSRILGDDCRQALQLRHWSEIVLGQVDFDGFDLTSPLGEIPNRMVAVSERARDDTIEKFPVLRGFVTGHGAGAVRLGTPVTGQRALSGAAPDQASDDLLEVMRRRWSGLENDGSPAQVAAFDRAALDELMADVRLLAARSLTGDLAAVPLSVSVTVLHGQAGVAGHYCLRPGARDLEPLGPVDAAQLGSFSNHYYWAGINMIMGLSVAPGIVFEVCPNAPFAAIHAAVGAFGHSFALAAARRGMFVRPVRAYREAALDSVTPDSELMVLQLICGTSRQARVGLDLI